MNFVLIVFASATTANRLKSVLYKKFRINSEVIQTPASLSDKGCSYCLRVRFEHADTVWKIVRENGLSSKGIYSDTDYHKIR